MVDTWTEFIGPNQGYVLELYDQYVADPNSVDPAMQAYFQRSGNGHAPSTPTAEEKPSSNGSSVPTSASVSAASTDVRKVVGAAKLARCIREYGHLAADIDPLGVPRPGDPMLVPATHGISEADLEALPGTIVWPEGGAEVGNCLQAIRRLRAIYSGPLGYEFDHVEEFEERTWLYEQVEKGVFAGPLTADEKRTLLHRLTEVEGFERYLHSVFVGQKRFSIEGDDMLVPMLDELVSESIDGGAQEILIGMAHRGRLNVLAHIMDKAYEAIFTEFHSTSPATAVVNVPADGSTGDVKYHLGAHRLLRGGPHGDVELTLANNPSHLGFVNPVTEGETRAAQDDRRSSGAPRQNFDRAVAVALHGDAAFPGEGVVAETLNLSCLEGYRTGGSVLIIVNNQVGFTTAPSSARSTLYASDVAKGYEIPIVHVNADYPEACLTAIRLALAYRRRFHKNFLIDLVGYRRWGHNEGDEPAFTQPRMYTQIASHPTVRARYARELIADGVLTKDDVTAMQNEVQGRLQQARESMHQTTSSAIPKPRRAVWNRDETPVSPDLLRQMNDEILRVPETFSVNPKLRRILDRRREIPDGKQTIDWAQAESLALASILADGTPIRFTGQDVERGTFSQRHLVLHDPDTGEQYVPLQHLSKARASFAIYNSPLSETAVMAFEYGYSVHAPESLVIWEAQFGDFANVGQVVIDQFLAASRAKWQEQPSLMLLLPHGYEGQGPEHSSGRLERYLQLAAEDNVRVANCTTSAQYFHLLRLHAASLADDRRPLILMSPKSLLRHPRAASSLADLADGSFLAVMEDQNALERTDRVTRLVLSTGKVSIDLVEAATKNSIDTGPIALARVELLYPFPKRELEHLISRFPNLTEVLWVQEEPANMGAWAYIGPRVQPLLPAGLAIQYIGRPERAATAEGSSDWYEEEQLRIVTAALSVERPMTAATRGMEHVS